jgi:hypothetical protein
MELLSVGVARSLWFVDVREMNPRGREFRTGLFSVLSEKYDFAKSPYDDNNETPNTKESPGYKFIDGSFVNPEGIEVMVNLTIFDDGLLAETRSSTDDADAFLDEVVQLAVDEFWLIFKPEMITRKVYVSELYVSPSRPLSDLNRKLDQMAARLTALTSMPDYPVRYEPAGLIFYSDPIPKQEPGVFRFERKTDSPFSHNKFYSIAPLPTEAHLKLLDELEQILVG